MKEKQYILVFCDKNNNIASIDSNYPMNAANALKQAREEMEREKYEEICIAEITAVKKLYKEITVKDIDI